MEFNLLESELSWDDEHRRQREIITTRIYLLFVSLAAIILVIYTSIDIQTEIVTVLSPSQERFDQLRLNSEYSATLDCPCQNINIPYHSFISIEPYYHQLCSSDFVTMNSAWISLLYSFEGGFQYSYDDYRLFAVPHFRLLNDLCSIANETLTEAIVQFNTSTMINKRVQSIETIKLQVDIILKRFRLSTPQTFVRTLDFVRYMAQGNGIVSSILSNWHFLSLDMDADWPSLWAEPRYYGDDNCSCGTNAKCTSQASFNGSIVPGFRVGCYPLEALLQSTLECLYNVSCIDQLKSMYQQSNVTFNPLNVTLSSSNMTVQSLVDSLLIEQWNTSMVYEQYYKTCAPLSCTYTFNRQVSLVYTVTTILGLLGGLTVVFGLITPVLVKIGYYLIMRRRQRAGRIGTMITVRELNNA